MILTFDNDIYPLLQETINNIKDAYLLVYAEKQSSQFEVTSKELSRELLGLILESSASMVFKSFVRKVPLVLCSLESDGGGLYIKPVLPNGVPAYTQAELARIKHNLEMNEYNQIH